MGRKGLELRISTVDEVITVGRIAYCYNSLTSEQKDRSLFYLNNFYRMLSLSQGFLTRGARNVSRGCGDAESLRLIRPTLLNTKKRYVTDFKSTSGK